MDQVMKNALRIPALLLAFFVSLTAHAQSTERLDRDATAALNALYAAAPGANALAARAKAVLVFPDVKKAAFLVGVQSGEGVLFEDGKITGHYSIGGVQAGLEAGAASYNYALFFMSDTALRGLLERRDGFDIGFDPNIVFVSVGATKEATAATAQADVYGYVFGEQGLMGGLSLQGVKITRLDR
jgi:lipid-binding SYLF domain-containing protein